MSEEGDRRHAARANISAAARVLRSGPGEVYCACRAGQYLRLKHRSIGREPYGRTLHVSPYLGEYQVRESGAEEALSSFPLDANGKGAAIGLAIRLAGAGGKVYVHGADGLVDAVLGGIEP